MVYFIFKPRYSKRRYVEELVKKRDGYATKIAEIEDTLRRGEVHIRRNSCSPREDEPGWVYWQNSYNLLKGEKGWVYWQKQLEELNKMHKRIEVKCLRIAFVYGIL